MSGDMFLKVEGSRSGVVKGEANDSTHTNEIDILDWSWGMRSASTALMSVMRNNELIKKAVLTVRKAGNKPIEYFIVTIENARITSYDVCNDSGTVPRLLEKLSLSFQKISIDYYPQDATGARKGGSNFSADVSPST